MQSSHQIAYRLIARLKSERGSVEAAMMIIPLLFLFLVGMQLAISAHSRNMEKLAVQSATNRSAISGEFSDGDEFIHIESSGDDQELDLLVKRIDKPLISLIPTLGDLFGASPQLTVEGVAIVENRR